MTVQDQIKLANNTTFKSIVTKALNKAFEMLIDTYQTDESRTKIIHDKLYNYGLSFTKRGIATDGERASLIGRLLDDVDYIDPDTQTENCYNQIFGIIEADYIASFIQTPANSTISWIEIMSGYVLGDEDLKA